MGKSKISSVDDQKRLGTTFHRTFWLNRFMILQVLNLIWEPKSDINTITQITRSEIREKGHLGSRQVEAFPRYAIGSGLLTDNLYRLTMFGEYALRHDNLLSMPGTLWLMHYHLSAEHGPGPLFWHELVTNCFRSGDTFLHEDIVCQIANIFKQFEGKPLSNRSASTTTTIFLGTYIKNDGLGKLGILEEMGNKTYRVLEPELPPSWVVALAILDYWKAHFPNQVTINLNDLLDEKGLTSQFMISRSRLTFVLGEMQEAGIVELFCVAPPYQVVLLQSDPEPLYRRLYASNECD